MKIVRIYSCRVTLHYTTILSTVDSLSRQTPQTDKNLDEAFQAQSNAMSGVA